MTKYRPEDWQDWIDRLQSDGRDLTDWESKFVYDMSCQIEESGSISPRQEEILERIYAQKTR